MDIVSPEQLRAYEMQEDLNVLEEEDNVNDPFVRPKRKPTQKQLDALKKGRETMRLKREKAKQQSNPAEIEISNMAYKLGRNLTWSERREIEKKHGIDIHGNKKMSKPKTKKVQIAPDATDINSVVERVEAIEDVATPKQQEQIEQIKQLSQEELDEAEFSKFIKMMDKFETMVSKLEEKKRLEQEEAERKEKELEERYFQKFMEKQKLQATSKPSNAGVITTQSHYIEPKRTGPELTEEEQKFSSYF